MNPGLPGMPTKGFVVSIAAIAERQTLNSFVELVASAGPLDIDANPSDPSGNDGRRAWPAEH